MPSSKKTNTNKNVRPVKTTNPPIARPAAVSASEAGAGWGLLAKVALAAGLFFIPLMFGQWTADNWEIHKTIVLILAVTLAWIGFFGQTLKRRTIDWSWHPLDWLVMGIVLSAGIGTVISVKPWQSLIGIQGLSSETLPVIIGGASIYFLSGLLMRHRMDRLIMWSSALLGIGLAIILQFLQLAKVSPWPTPFNNDQLFSPLTNSPIQVAILAAVIGVVGLMMWGRAKEKWAKYALATMVLMAWLTLMFISQPVAWAVFALGMVVVVVGEAGRGKSASIKLIVTAVIIAALGMIAQFVQLKNYADVPATNEINLDQATSANIALTTLTHRPVLGSGPNTWYQDFINYRSEAFNDNVYWNQRFIRAGNQWWDLLATGGLVTIALWWGLIIMSGWIIWRQLKKTVSFTPLVVLFLLGAAVIIACLTTWSFVFWMLLWLGLGLNRAKIAAENKSNHRPIGSLLPLSFALVIILAVGGWYVIGQSYVGEIYLQRAQNQINKVESLDKIIASLNSVLKINKHNIDAGVLLANADVVKAQIAIQASQTDQAQAYLTAAINQMSQVKKIDPNNPSVYEADNNLLNNLAGYYANVEEQANANFAKLRELEPANPIHDVGYGQTLMVMRARLLSAAPPTDQDKTTAENYYKTAVQAYDQALQKRPAYAQAKYARAQANQEAGQYQAALDDLDSLTAEYPTTTIFWSAKGVALAKLEKLELAAAAFEQALSLDSTSPDIYLSFADIYTTKQPDQAKAVLQRGLTAIPNDQSLTDALAKLNP